ncbi:MAG: hypothetical protein HC903_18940 [Methylacidiphilales bacterium]|nr:hypothetical protein [Candidatus Methylacidiphilales bacterium]
MRQIPTKKAGDRPLPAIRISSKKSCDEPLQVRLLLSVAHLFEVEKLNVAYWALGIGDFGIRNQESGIRNQESGIRNQESGIRILRRLY